MGCSIHKEMQLIVDHGGNEKVSDLKYTGACYKPNRRVQTTFNSFDRTVDVFSLVATDKNSSLFFALSSLFYFNVSILLCYSFKRVTVTKCLQTRLL